MPPFARPEIVCCANSELLSEPITRKMQPVTIRDGTIQPDVGRTTGPRCLIESAAISTPGSSRRIVSRDESSSLVPSNATRPTSST